MKEKLFSKKGASLIIIASLILILTGGAFAVLFYTTTSDENTIKLGNITMSYSESNNVINVQNALPMSDAKGKEQTEYFDFSVSSNASTNANDDEGIKIPYHIVLEEREVDEGKSKLTSNEIKVYLTKLNGSTEEVVTGPILLSELENKGIHYYLYQTTNVHKNTQGAITTDYRIRAWIDEKAEGSKFTKETIYQYKFGININTEKEGNSGEEPEKVVLTVTGLTAKVGTGGLVADEHSATEQLQATTDYRYTGANPDNYINFNNETWRIIGIFDTDDGTGRIEKRIKIIRNSIGEIAWNTSNRSINDWSKVTLNILLNEGDYYNRTGDYSTNGLTEKAKSYIADAKWYLGGIDHLAGLTGQLYENERGTNVYAGNSIDWIGEVGLMYTSDYGYATSGGITNNREICLQKKFYNWKDNYSDCKNNNWLYDSSNNQTTISPNINDSSNVFVVNSEGEMQTFYGGGNNAIRPSVYLKSDIKLTGEGTASVPYEIK